jgi:hypothetical protein
MEGRALLPEVRDPLILTSCLDLLAGTPCGKRERLSASTALRAVRLLAAAQVFRTSKEIAELWPAERDQRERWVAVIRAHLDPDGFAAAWAEASEMTLEQAIREAVRVEL